MSLVQCPLAMATSLPSRNVPWNILNWKMVAMVHLISQLILRTSPPLQQSQQFLAIDAEAMILAGFWVIFLLACIVVPMLNR